jgi:Family of unknown function (DUF6084)
VSTGAQAARDGAVAVPALDITVASAAAVAHAAAPTLRFGLELTCRSATPVRAVLLTAQVQIVVARRPYDAQTRERLTEVLGAPSSSTSPVRALAFAQPTVTVPPFTGRTRVVLDVPCTYDFEVAAAKYLHALLDGDVPLEFLFSGTVFHAAAGGALRATRIPWEVESAFRLPLATWREAVDACFPHSAWVRLDRDSFDRLARFKAARALPTWDAVVDALLEEQ